MCTIERGRLNHFLNNDPLDFCYYSVIFFPEEVFKYVLITTYAALGLDGS